MTQSKQYDYYDLIEFLSHKHLPVPIVMKILIHELHYSFEEAIALIEKIPMSRKKRNERFFHCPQCGKPSFFTGICDECHYWEEMAIDAECDSDPTFDNYYQQKKVSNQAKKTVFKNIIIHKQTSKLRYINNTSIFRTNKCWILDYE